MMEAFFRRKSAPSSQSESHHRAWPARPPVAAEWRRIDRKGRDHHFVARDLQQSRHLLGIETTMDNESIHVGNEPATQTNHFALLRRRQMVQENVVSLQQDHPSSVWQPLTDSRVARRRSTDCSAGPHRVASNRQANRPTLRLLRIEFPGHPSASRSSAGRVSRRRSRPPCATPTRSSGLQSRVRRSGAGTLRNHGNCWSR